MKRDFTLKVYKEFIETFLNAGYSIYTFEEYLESNPLDNYLVLRHDVDKTPQNALKMAQLENNLGVKATYYFRILNCSNNPTIIRKIVDLGHELGYHYEDLTLARGDFNKAIEYFKTNLEYFRGYYDIKTIAYHGSPMTKWFNQDLWEKFDYKDYGILAEPFLDVDYEKNYYLTDTGRSWNAFDYSVRDKVIQGTHNNHYYNTFQIIKAIKNGSFPSRVFLNIHSQRWHENFVPWLWELIFQNIKNQIKRMIFVKK